MQLPPLKVYLDDERKAPEGWTKCSTYQGAIEWLESQMVAIISLDHDLNPSHYQGDYSDGQTGLDVLFWLLDEVSRNPAFHVPELRVHSLNRKRAPKMQHLIHLIEAKKAGASECE